MSDVPVDADDDVDPGDVVDVTAPDAPTEPVLDPNDPRTCIIKSLAIEAPGRPDIVVDLTGPNALEELKKKPFVIKEGAKFRTKVVFQVQHSILSG